MKALLIMSLGCCIGAQEHAQSPSATSLCLSEQVKALLSPPLLVGDSGRRQSLSPGLEKATHRSKNKKKLEQEFEKTPPSSPGSTSPEQIKNSESSIIAITKPGSPNASGRRQSSPQIGSPLKKSPNSSFGKLPVFSPASNRSKTALPVSSQTNTK